MSDIEPDLTARDYQALGAFRRAIREFLAFSEAGAREHGLTTQQHQALLTIKCHTESEPISIGELAASLLIKNHSAVGLVERLVERDLVSRRPFETDRRRVALALRPRGEEVIAAISRRNLAQLSQAADIMTGLVETARRIAPEAPLADAP